MDDLRYLVLKKPKYYNLGGSNPITGKPHRFQLVKNPVTIVADYSMILDVVYSRLVPQSIVCYREYKGKYLVQGNSLIQS